MKANRVEPFLREIALQREKVENWNEYPYSIPAIRGLETLPIHPKLTFLVGENGCGKSTVIEAIAVAAGFNAEDGSKNFAFSTRASESPLHTVIRLVRGTRRPKTGFFLRAESFFNVASEVDRLGGRDLDFMAK